MKNEKYTFSARTLSNDSAPTNASAKDSAPINLATIQFFIAAYKADKIIEFDPNLKGFFIDSKIINALENANGLFLYLAKKVPPYGNDYTLIAVPAKTVAGKDELLIESALEWHDPVIGLMHKPTNEDQIGYGQFE